MSTIFYTICSVLLILVTAAIASPFWRKDPTTPSLISQEAVDDQERADLIQFLSESDNQFDLCF